MKQVTGLEAKYQSEKKDKELIKEKVASEKKTVITYALSVGLMLFLVLAFIAFRGYLNKKKYATIIETANQEIKIKSSELASRNKDVTDSINYAKRIQYAILPNDEAIYKAFPESFIFFKPKDIVSGDFYWFHEINKNEFILACGDCTGHGVPGAFMTVIGSNLLNQIVIEKKVFSPARILTEIDMLLNTTLKQDYEEAKGVQDGMDIALIKVNTTKKECVITSAKRPVVLIRDNQIVETKGSKFSVGGMRSGIKEFAEHTASYKSGDQLYMFTDGFCDQFGGDKGKKFSSKRLKEFLLEKNKLTMGEQKQNLENAIIEWQGRLEQVDDILIIGVKFI
jgi:serine phosphatase RsbU (regulator of sigma subunit)